MPGAGEGPRRFSPAWELLEGENVKAGMRRAFVNVGPVARPGGSFDDYTSHESGGMVPAINGLDLVPSAMTAADIVTGAARWVDEWTHEQVDAGGDLYADV